MKFPGMRKAAPVVRAALPFALIFAVFLALALFPRPQGTKAEAKCIVRVWNVDTFEGGKGSRTAFLARAARLAEKSAENVYYYVTSYSKTGFRDAVERGDLPDVLSFGVGLGDISRLCLPLDASFAGGETAEGCLAVPWCAGGYTLYSLDENFSDGGEVAVSQGGDNLAAVAARLGGISGAEMGSEEAYVGFLNKKYRYLLGTQRDRCRFLARNVQVYERALGGYCDLFQCVAVLSADKKEAAMTLIGALRSEEIQGALGDIGMGRAEECGGAYTVGVFTPEETLVKIAETARAGNVTNFADKYLKKV